jgi:hypothetical protein
MVLSSSGSDVERLRGDHLPIGAAADFDAFYASRLPEPCPEETGLLLTCDGSAFPVMPGALRPATAKAAKAAQDAGNTRETRC